MIRIGPHSQPKRGRPSLRAQLEPWLRKMHELVKNGMSRRRAARTIVDRYEHLLPRGSVKHRSYESSEDLLRRAYVFWAAEQEELEARIRVALEIGEQMQKSFQAAAAQFRTPAMQQFIKNWSPNKEEEVWRKVAAKFDLSKFM